MSAFLERQMREAVAVGSDHPTVHTAAAAEGFATELSARELERREIAT